MWALADLAEVVLFSWFVRKLMSLLMRVFWVLWSLGTMLEGFSKLYQEYVINWVEYTLLHALRYEQLYVLFTI